MLLDIVRQDFRRRSPVCGYVFNPKH